MKLIDILVRELPRRGRWPDGADFAVQNYRDGGIKFGKNPIEIAISEKWNNELWQGEWNFSTQHDFICHEVSTDYREAIISRGDYEAALAASKPEWNGVGLPPVGLVCEGQFPRHPGISFEWQECLVLYVFERECAVQSKGTSTLHYCDDFRPIRSEADKKKQAEINELIDAINLTLTDIYSSRVFMDAIRDRRIPGIRVE